MAKSSRIDITLLSQELLDLINASIKIFPITQEDVTGNSNPNSYEYGRVYNTTDNLTYIYRWETNKWVKLGAEDKSVDWTTDVKNKPTTFPPEAHNHTKSNITDFTHNHTKSEISDFTHTHPKAQITDFPTLATVAISGSYNDLTDKPVISGGAGIDDAVIATDKTWSSNKINTQLTSKADASTVTTLQGQIASKADASTLSGHTGNSTIHVTQGDKDNITALILAAHGHDNKALLDLLISNGNGSQFLANDGTYKTVISGGGATIDDTVAATDKVYSSSKTAQVSATDRATAIASAQATLNTHKTSTDHDGRYYTESEIDALLSNKADTTTTNSLQTQISGKADSSTVSGHTGNSTIHVTQGDKDNIQALILASHAHSNRTLLDSLISNGSGTQYLANDGTYKTIVSGVGDVTLTGVQTLTNKTLTSPKINTIKDTVFSKDALAIEGATDAVTYLKIAGHATKPQITSEGTPANIDINISPKGTGKVLIKLDEVVTAVAAMTMINKTMSGSNNTFSNISADSTVDGITNKVYTSTEKTKLAGIATGATNYTHPANHAPSIISQDSSNRFVTDAEKTTWNAKQAALSGDVAGHYHSADRSTDNHVSGTTNKVFSAAEQTKLAGIASGAEVNVNADWNAVSGDAQILNKPTIPTQTSQLTNNSNFVVDAGYVHTDNNYTTSEKNKLSGIATSATANSTDAQLRDRSTHTGSQTASTISDFSTAVSTNTAVTNATNHIADGQLHLTESQRLRLNIIANAGDGTQFLSDDGTYKTVSSGPGASTASSVSITDAAGLYTATNVEDALQEMALGIVSLFEGLPASMIALEDASEHFEATTVEEALAELAAALNNQLGNYIIRVMTAAAYTGLGVKDPNTIYFTTA